MSKAPIPWSRPDVGAAELAQIQDAFAADWLTMGPRVAAFEAVMAARIGVPHAIAVSNGSVALDIALRIIGIEPGDEVIVPAFTYYATAAAVSRVGAVPVFVDIDPATCNLDPSLLAGACSKRTRAVLFIDYGGNPAAVDELKNEAKRLGLTLVQDAAHSIGAVYKGRAMGAETEISTMSFHMAKTMTTVEGGMIFTHNKKFDRLARVYRNQGEAGKYEHVVLGDNARMSDISAGIGIAQERKLDGFLAGRKRAAEAYSARFLGHNSVRHIGCRSPGSAHANFLYSICVPQRSAVEKALKADGIDYRICYPMPLQEQGLYKSGRTPCRVTPSPATASVTSAIISLPMFPIMTDAQIDRVTTAVLGALV